MCPKNNQNREDHFCWVNICAVVLALFAVGVLALLLPKPTVSEVEKRELAKKPQWTLSSWFSGEFAKQYDAYYADTFPSREELVTVAAKIESMEGIHPNDVRIYQSNTQTQAVQASGTVQTEQPDGQQSVQTLGESGEQDGQEIDYSAYDDPNAPGNGLTDEGTNGEQAGNLFLYKNMGMQIFGASQSLSTRYAQTINSYAKDLPGVNVYSLIAPTSIAFYLPEGYESIASDQREDIDFVNSLFSDAVTPVDAYSELEKNKDEYIYFRTDHHWTVRGAYQAYIAFCKQAGLTPVSLEQMEHHQIDGFLGTFYSQTHDAQLGATPDFVEYFVPPVEYEVWRYESASPYKPIESTLFASYATSGPNTYSVFLHGDLPLTHVKTNNHTGRKIMLIKESFGNAFAPFLVNNFDEVYIVDQRYFELGVEDFIRSHGITDLLFLNNIFAVNTGVRIDELASIQNQTYTYTPPVQTTKPAEQQQTPAATEEQKADQTQQTPQTTTPAQPAPQQEQATTQPPAQQAQPAQQQKEEPEERPRLGHYRN